MMLDQGSFLSEKQFQCAICLDVFDNPVSTPCGHSYCMTCIGQYWNGVRRYQCPLCKKTFKKKPELHINRTLREITEQFKKMQEEDWAHGGLERGESQGKGLDKRALKQGHFFGDLFIEMRHRFLNSPPSAEPHNSQSPGLQPMAMEATDPRNVQPKELTRKVSLRRYTLSGAADSRGTPQCEKHHQNLDLFCKSDGECICSECGDVDHQSHDITSAEKEWLTSKTEIIIAERKIQEMITQRLKKVEEIKLSLEELQMTAQRETMESLHVFEALLTFLERSQAELLEVIEKGRCSAECKAEGMMRELELELTELRKRGVELGKLAQTDDCISGLKSYTSHLNTIIPVKEWDGVSVTFDLGTRSICSSLHELSVHFQEKLQKFSETCLSTLTDLLPLTAQPRIKKIEEYAVNVILDPSTAHPLLILSEDRKKVRCGDRHQQVPNNPERFDCMVSVLGQEAFIHGQHYWEVDVGAKTDWDLGVASHSINRKGKVSVDPSSGYWFLSLRNKTNYAFGTDLSLTVPLHTKPRKIGVFVDCEKGQISFYHVEAKMHIYTFTGTFFEAVYPFFSPCTNKSGKNDAALVITPVLLPV